jgi:hypothetical protein
MLKRLSLCFALVSGLVIACGGGERRSNVFDETPKDPNKDGQGGFKDNGAVNGGPKECAKSEAEAVKPPVDIIMIVDQSGSMSEEIAAIKQNINSLSDFLNLTGLDYHVIMIGTVGTGSFDICVPPPLGGPACASNGNLFRTVNRNVQSNDALSIILSTYDQASGPMAWKDFLRADAMKVFIPVTDDNAYTPKSTQFDTDLLAKPGGQFGTAQARRYVFYPITGAPAYPQETGGPGPGGTCGNGMVNTGAEYIALAKLTNGVWWPLCNTNFGGVFEEIGKNIADTIACELPVPKPENGEEINHSQVNVKVVPGDGSAEKEVLQDSSVDCDKADGWQYNADKTKILLCGSACADVRKDNGAKVTVLFGCDTKVK